MQNATSSACTGAPTAVMLAGPSLTEGFPATSPALRRLEFSTTGSWALEDVVTLSADIHDANRKNATDLVWNTLYSFTEQYNMTDLSPASFAALASRMAIESSPEWGVYRGVTRHSLFCSGYNPTTAQMSANSPCAVLCSPECKASWISWLNGTSTDGATCAECK